MLDTRLVLREWRVSQIRLCQSPRAGGHPRQHADRRAGSRGFGLGLSTPFGCSHHTSTWDRTQGHLNQIRKFSDCVGRREQS